MTTPPKARCAKRILVITEHPAVRQGLTLVLGTEGVGLCSAACRAVEAPDLLRAKTFDVAVIEHSIGDKDMRALLADLRARKLPPLVCSRQEGPADVQQALEAGAAGYFTTGEVPHDVARAVRGVVEGRIVVSPRAAERLGNKGCLP